MAEGRIFVELKGGPKTLNIIIFGLFLLVVSMYVLYYLWISSMLELLIRMPSMLPTEGSFISFSNVTTVKIDAKYLATVTLTTVGYGNAIPTSEGAQILMCILVVGVGGIMTRMLFYTFDIFVDRVILYYPRRNRTFNVLFFDGGIICSIVKIPTACLLIAVPIYTGAWIIKAYESLDKDRWFDAYYLSIISASTVGYGDKVFKTEEGRIFAGTWLFIAVYLVDRGLFMLARILPDGFIRLFTYICKRKTHDVDVAPNYRFKERRQ